MVKGRCRPLPGACTAAVAIAMPWLAVLLYGHGDGHPSVTAHGARWRRRGFTTAGWVAGVDVKVEAGETGRWGDDVGRTGALGIGIVCE